MKPPLLLMELDAGNYLLQGGFLLFLILPLFILMLWYVRTAYVTKAVLCILPIAFCAIFGWMRIDAAYDFLNEYTAVSTAFAHSYQGNIHDWVEEDTKTPYIVIVKAKKHVCHITLHSRQEYFKQYMHFVPAVQ